MIREQTPKLISGVESVLRLLEDTRWHAGIRYGLRLL